MSSWMKEISWKSNRRVVPVDLTNGLHWGGLLTNQRPRTSRTNLSKAELICLWAWQHARSKFSKMRWDPLFLQKELFYILSSDFWIWASTFKRVEFRTLDWKPKTKYQTDRDCHSLSSCRSQKIKSIVLRSKLNAIYWLTRWPLSSRNVMRNIYG